MGKIYIYIYIQYIYIYIYIYIYSTCPYMSPKNSVLLPFPKKMPSLYRIWRSWNARLQRRRSDVIFDGKLPQFSMQFDHGEPRC